MITYQNGVFMNYLIGGGQPQRLFPTDTVFIAGVSAGQVIVPAFAGQRIAVYQFSVFNSSAVGDSLTVFSSNPTNNIRVIYTPPRGGYYREEFTGTPLFETRVGQSLVVDNYTYSIYINLKYLIYTP